MSNLTYSIAKANINTVDWTGATKFRVLLATTTYVPSAAHAHVSDVTNEATGTGYVRKLLGTLTRAANGANYDYKAVAAAWTTLTSTFRYAIVYCDVQGSDARDRVAGLLPRPHDAGDRGGELHAELRRRVTRRGVPGYVSTVDSTAATLVVTPSAPTMGITVSSSPAVFVLVPVQPEPWNGGGTDVAGAGAGMTLSLTLAMG